MLGSAHFDTMTHFRLLLVAVLVLFSRPALRGAVPQLLNYQGRVTAAGTNYDGTGLFKFALVNGDGSVTYWRSSADTSPVDGVPDTAVSLPVTKGLYAVLLGDAAVPNMAALPVSVFSNNDVRLRVWFDDGVHGQQQLTPDQRIAAVGYAMMSSDVTDGAITTAKIAPGAVGAAQLAPGAASANLNASGQTAVPATALVMSNTIDPALAAAGYVNIGSFLSNTGDNWQQKADINIGGGQRSLHSAVWTGAEMIVWGGTSSTTQYFNNGSRFNPATNSWTSISAPGTPTARNRHFAFWTGREMLIYGGTSAAGLERSGSRYNPISNVWTAVNSANSPTAHDSAVAVWTGTEMIVYGGSGSDGDISGGAYYNPLNDSWTPIASGGPVGRSNQLAVWSGSEMIVWGGSSLASGGTFFADGARYNRAANSWTAMSTTNVPAARAFATAVWTGSEMIVWGGNGTSSDLNTGARYDPVKDTWIAVSTTNAPTGRHGHSAVWDGKNMVIWGGIRGSGYLNTGARYDPALNTWTALPPNNAAAAGRTEHTAIAAGSDMLIFGGRSDSGGSSVYYKDTYLESLSHLVYIYQHP